MLTHSLIHWAAVENYFSEAETRGALSLTHMTHSHEQADGGKKHMLLSGFKQADNIFPL